MFAKADAADAVSAFCVMSNNYGGPDMIKVIGFDIGGTLMEYKNMPNVWIDYYKTGFETVRNRLGLHISDDDIAGSVEVLRGYNPKVKYREEDIAPKVIFADATSHWKCSFDLEKVIDVFYRSMGLVPYIYPDTVNTLKKLRKDGYKIATLTDVATGMPDELHKSYFPSLCHILICTFPRFPADTGSPTPKALQILRSISAYRLRKWFLSAMRKKI